MNRQGGINGLWKWDGCVVCHDVSEVTVHLDITLIHDSQACKVCCCLQTSEVSVKQTLQILPSIGLSSHVCHGS